jgi:hypothetical protein
VIILLAVLFGLAIGAPLGYLYAYRQVAPTLRLVAEKLGIQR